MVVLSCAIGFALTYGIVYGNIAISNIQLTLHTDFAQFGLLYTLLIMLSLTVAVGVWLDKFLDTKLIEK